MKIKDSDIITYRMQVCVECKANGNNIYDDTDDCHGNNDDIRDCIDANLYSGVGDDW